MVLDLNSSLYYLFVPQQTPQVVHWTTKNPPHHLVGREHL